MKRSQVERVEARGNYSAVHAAWPSGRPGRASQLPAADSGSPAGRPLAGAAGEPFASSSVTASCERVEARGPRPGVMAWHRIRARNVCLEWKMHVMNPFGIRFDLLPLLHGASGSKAMEAPRWKWVWGGRGVGGRKERGAARAGAGRAEAHARTGPPVSPPSS